MSQFFISTIVLVSGICLSLLCEAGERIKKSDPAVRQFCETDVYTWEKSECLELIRESYFIDKLAFEICSSGPSAFRCLKDILNYSFDASRLSDCKRESSSYKSQTCLMDSFYSAREIREALPLLASKKLLDRRTAFGGGYPGEDSEAAEGAFKGGLQDLSESNEYLEYEKACVLAEGEMKVDTNSFDPRFPGFSQSPCDYNGIGTSVISGGVGSSTRQVPMIECLVSMNLRCLEK